MVYKAQGKEIDLEKITRLYPAVTVEVEGETAQVSLEWAEMKKDAVVLRAYVLVFDVDPLDKRPDNRVELVYQTKDELMAAMREVAGYFEKKGGKGH